MALGGERPQQLLCAVVDRCVPVMELWFTGGRGTSNDPLRVEVLGQLRGDASTEASRALEQLTERHGPNLYVDLSRATDIGEDAVMMLAELQGRVACRQGSVIAEPPLVPPFGVAAVTHHHPEYTADTTGAHVRNTPLVSRDGAGTDGATMLL